MCVVKWDALTSHLTTSHLTRSCFCARLGQSDASRIAPRESSQAFVVEFSRDRTCPQVFEIQFPLDKISRLRVPGYVKRKERLSSGPFQVFYRRRAVRLDYCVDWAATSAHVTIHVKDHRATREHASAACAIETMNCIKRNTSESDQTAASFLLMRRRGASSSAGATRATCERESGNCLTYHAG